MDSSVTVNRELVIEVPSAMTHPNTTGTMHVQNNIDKQLKSNFLFMSL